MAKRIRTIKVVNPKTGETEKWTPERKRLFEITYGVEVKPPAEKQKDNG